MKLFLKDQRPLLAVFILQLLTVSGVFWLDGYRNIAMILYAALLSVCLLAVYFVWRFITNRSLYRSLERADALDSFKSIAPKTPISEAVHRSLKRQYRHYASELNSQQNKINNHVQFIGQWVHQMKTPVSVIHLMVQDRDDEFAMAIGDEIDRIRKGLDLVLHTARLDSFSHDFVVEQVDLERLAKSAVTAQKRLFIRSKLFPRFEFNTMKGSLKAATDEKWLSFVLTQILTNAVRYTAKEQGSIIIRGFIRDGGPVLEIQDEGVGIPASDLPRVFDPYFTGENGRNFRESTGMGLYLVKKICDELGHRVELESLQGQGTIVRIRFGREHDNLTRK